VNFPTTLGETNPAIAPLSMPATGETVTSVNPDWQQAEQESIETAEALRYLLKREKPSRNTTELQPPPKTRRTSRPSVGQITKRLGFRLWQFLQVPQKPLDKVGDALLWVMVAAVIRVASGFLLAAFPGLKPLLILLMLTPAALTVYLALCLPKARFLSLYRPFLILLGLLLGGRV
jgi:hypothetical protein